MVLRKRDWILLVLKRSPLDRIHIMKSLFLIWHRSGREISHFFEFEPYLYGPCSFEVYSELDKLTAERLILQSPHPIPTWVDYRLTELGQTEAEEARKRASPAVVKLVEKVAAEVSQLNFHELLVTVYEEAPDYAVNSMFRGVIK